MSEKPKYCPVCGTKTGTALNITKHIWELACESCNASHVIFVRDSISLEDIVKP